MAELSSKVPSQLNSAGYVMSGSALIAIGPFFVEFSNLPAITLSFYRMLIGGIVFLCISLLRGERIPVKKSLLIPCLFAGLLLGLDLFAWNQSVLYIGAGLSTVLANLEILFLIVVGCVLYKEKLSSLFLKMCVLIIVGIYFLIFPYLAKIHISYGFGIFLALGASFIYSLYLLLLKVIGNKSPETSSTMTLSLICLIGSLMLGIFMAVHHPSSFYIPDSHSISCLVSNSLISQVFGWWLITKGIKNLSLSFAGLLLLTQPALTFICDCSFLGRNTAWIQILGCIILLSAVYRMVIEEKKKEIVHEN